MAIIKVISSKNIAKLDNYIVSGSAHDNLYGNKRDLAIDAHNLRKDYQGGYSPLYMASQQYAVREVAGKQHKKVQGHHLIISFSENDFPPIKDPKKNQKQVQKQTKQALKLVNDLLQQELPKSAQYLIGIQRDGKSHMLHAHVALNSVLVNGKTLDTNTLSLLHRKQQKTIQKKRVTSFTKGLIDRMQDFMQDHFEKVTGRKYERVAMPTDPQSIVKSSEQQIASRSNGYVWKDDLKSTIVEAAQNSIDQDEFIANLGVNGVKVKQRRASIGKDKQGKKIYRKAFTYSFKGADGKAHTSRDFAYTKTGAIRGLGQAFTPDNLDKVFELVRQQQKHQEAEELNQYSQININEIKKEDDKDAKSTRSVSSPQTTNREPREPEEDFDRFETVRRVKVANKHKTYNTDNYDRNTEEQQRKLDEQRRQEAIEREARLYQQQHEEQLAEAERQRKDAERKRKNKNRKLKRKYKPELNTTEPKTKRLARKTNSNLKPADGLKQQPTSDEPEFE